MASPWRKSSMMVMIDLFDYLERWKRMRLCCAGRVEAVQEVGRARRYPVLPRWLLTVSNERLGQGGGSCGRYVRCWEVTIVVLRDRLPCAVSLVWDSPGSGTL